MDAIEDLESTPNPVKLWCMLHTGSDVFDVDVPTNAFISNLKELVKAKNPSDLRDIDARHLRLVKVNANDGTPVLSNALDGNARRKIADAVHAAVRGGRNVEDGTFKPVENATLKSRVLTPAPTATIARYHFKPPPAAVSPDDMADDDFVPQQFIHILVVLPEGVSLQTAVVPTHPALYRAAESVLPISQEYDIDYNDPLTLPRNAVVQSLIEKLDTFKVVGVLSPPASGKTSLVSLAIWALVHPEGARSSNAKIARVDCRFFDGTQSPEMFILGRVQQAYADIDSWPKLCGELDYLFLDDAQFLYNMTDTAATSSWIDAFIKQHKTVRVAFFASFHMGAITDFASSPSYPKTITFRELQLTPVEQEDLFNRIVEHPRYKPHKGWFEEFYRLLRAECNGHVGMLRKLSQDMLNHFIGLHKHHPTFDDAVEHYFAGGFLTNQSLGRFFRVPEDDGVLTGDLLQFKGSTLNEQEKTMLDHIIVNGYVEARTTAVLNQARRLIRLVVLNIDDHQHLKFATPIHERFFARLAYPCDLKNPPNDIDDWICMVLQTFEPRRLKQWESSNAQSFNKEGPIQHQFWRGASFCLAARDVLAAEVSKTLLPDGRTETHTKGELDFWINGGKRWAVELMVCGEGISTHLGKFGRFYNVLKPREWRVIDFRPYTMAIRKREAGLVHVRVSDDCTAAVVEVSKDVLKGGTMVLETKHTSVSLTGQPPVDGLSYAFTWVQL
ncbi:hypothetical protein BJ742DRAFT_821073 [Cladochytrium replicatum]|nr:hypothetical protein BJ742DRAFT_821073 [Cladochytrium replicatum]